MSDQTPLDDEPAPLSAPTGRAHSRPVVRLRPKAEARAVRLGFPWVYADELVTDRRTALERRYIHDHRWCHATDIEALASGGQAVYPQQLGELLAEANRLADGSATVATPPRRIR